MDIQIRLLTVRVIRRIDRMPSYAEMLGILDQSTFHGVPVPAAPQQTENKGGHPYGTN